MSKKRILSNGYSSYWKDDGLRTDNKPYKEIIVLDTANYKSEYSEAEPFKAILLEITDYPCYWVRSLITGNTYELYEWQIYFKK